MSQARASNQAERPHCLYECDYYTWALVNAAAIRERRLEDVDLDNVAAEIEDLGKSQQSALESHLNVLLLHLLKLQYQPRRSTRSWQLTVKEQRLALRKVLRRNPGLRGETKLREILNDAYQEARVAAARATRLREERFPPDSPWTFQQAEDDKFFPGKASHPG
jgi:uncharacterized protein DUF29